MLEQAVVILLTPILILFIFIPIYISRLFVLLLSKIFKRNFSGILESRSTFLAVQDIYTNPRINLSVTSVIQGGFSRDSCIKQFQSSILDLTKGPNSRELKYKHLKEYITPWMGFFFWAKDKEFNLQNHIKLMTLNSKRNLVETNNETDDFKPISTEELKIIEKTLLERPYAPNRSPWELIIIPNFQPKFRINGVKYDVGIFRIHHAMTDGHSILKMWNSNKQSNKKIEKQMIKISKMNPLLNLYTTIRTPFELMHQILFSKPDTNEFHLDNKVLNANSNFHLIETDRIPLGYLKEIRHHFEVQFLSVICSGITFGIRNSMKREGMELPQSFTCTLPFPYPGHPDRMSNHWSAMTLEPPLTLEDSVERLKFIDDQISLMKRSISPIISFKVQPLIGSLFYWMVKPLAALKNPTGLISDFPGPSSQICQFGGIVSDLHFNLAFPMGRIGLMFTSISYNGYWKMSISVHQALLSCHSKVKDLNDDILKEFSNLHYQLKV